MVYTWHIALSLKNPMPIFHAKKVSSRRTSKGTDHSSCSTLSMRQWGFQTPWVSPIHGGFHESSKTSHQRGQPHSQDKWKKPFIKSHHNFFLSNRSPAALAKVLLSLIRAKATGSNCRANLSNCFCKPFATKPIPRGHVKDRELALQGPRSHHLQQVLCAARCCHL